MVHASIDVSAMATNEMIVGDSEPIIAFRISWSWCTQMLYAGFGVVMSFVVRVASEHGLEPSINPRRSYPVKRVWN